MIYEMILPISAVATKKMFRMGKDFTMLSLVGTVTDETVAIEIPTVENPDETVDANWTALKQATNAIILNADNNAIPLSAIPSLIRLNKDAGIADNAYGVLRC